MPLSGTKPFVLITGANRGLGLRLAASYARDGWQVHGTAREPARAANLLAIDGVAAVHQLDVTDPDSVRALAQALDRQPIDLLLHHAASRAPWDAYLGDLDYAGWAEVLETNLFGPLRVTEALLANLRAGRRRQVVILTDHAGGRRHQR